MSTSFVQNLQVSNQIRVPGTTIGAVLCNQGMLSDGAFSPVSPSTSGQTLQSDISSAAGAVWGAPPTGGVFGAISATGLIESSSGGFVVLKPPGVGVYQIQFLSARANALYPILTGILCEPGNDDYVVTYCRRTTTEFDIEIREQDNGTTGGLLRDGAFSFFVPTFDSLSITPPPPAASGILDTFCGRDTTGGQSINVMPPLTIALVPSFSPSPSTSFSYDFVTNRLKVCRTGTYLHQISVTVQRTGTGNANRQATIQLRRIPNSGIPPSELVNPYQITSRITSNNAVTSIGFSFVTTEVVNDELELVGFQTGASPGILQTVMNASAWCVVRLI